MAFEAEKDALDSIFAGLDQACRSGAFGLRDAAKLMGDVNTIGNLLHGGVNAVLSQIVQPLAEEQPSAEAQESAPENETPEVIPGTKQKVAKPK